MSTVTLHQFTKRGKELRNEDIEYGRFITLKSVRKNRNQKVAAWLVMLSSIAYLSIEAYMHSNVPFDFVALTVLAGLSILYLKDRGRTITFNHDEDRVDGLKVPVNFSDISHVEVSKSDNKMHCVSLVLINDKKFHIIKGNTTHKMHYFARKIATMTSSKLSILD